MANLVKTLVQLIFPHFKYRWKMISIVIILHNSNVAMNLFETLIQYCGSEIIPQCSQRRYYTCDKQVLWERVGAFFPRHNSFQPATRTVQAFVV